MDFDARGMPRHDLALMVGVRVRQARVDRGMSLGAAASRAGIGKGSLSEIEHGQRNPTLSTLYALARALGTPLSRLLDDRPGAQVASPGIVARLLDVRQEDDATVEVFALTLTPGGAHRSDGHGPGVSEQVLVTSGRVRVGIAEDLTVVAVGELASFAADVPHSYEALDSPAAAVNVIRTPR